MLSPSLLEEVASPLELLVVNEPELLLLAELELTTAFELLLLAELELTAVAFELLLLAELELVPPPLHCDAGFSAGKVRLVPMQ